MTATHAVPRGNNDPSPAKKKVCRGGHPGWREYICIDCGKDVRGDVPGASRSRPRLELAAAIAPPAPAAAAIALEQVPCDLIDVGTNVRIDPGELAEMAASIAELGVLQPVKVVGPRPDGRYGLVWGQRRLLASIQAGKATIPAWVVPTADVDAPGPRRSIEQLAENLQRADLNPIDEAKAIRDVLAGEKGLTQTELAKRLGMSPSWLANSLGLLELDEKVVEHVAGGTLSPSHAKALRGQSKTIQRTLAARVVREGLSAHDLERQVQWEKQAQVNVAANEKRAREEAAEIVVKSMTALEKAALPKDTTLVVSGWSHVGAVKTAVEKAGWTKTITSSQVWERGSAAVCDCVIWELQTGGYGRGPKVRKACVQPKHVNAKQRVEQDRREAADRERDAAKAKLAEALRTALGLNGTGGPLVSPLVSRLLLWNLLGWKRGEWAKPRISEEDRKAKHIDPWPVILALKDREVLDEVASTLAAAAANSNYGETPLPLAAIAVELLTGGPPAAPVRAKKAAS